MFKLPALQPQLTGRNVLEGRSQSADPGTRIKRSLLANNEDQNPVLVRNWVVQGAGVTQDVTNSDKFKSLALHAEVKLAEAFERCNKVSPISILPNGEEKPSKLHAAVACQLLGEFAELCGPFSRVLKKLRDELVRCIYSVYYESDRGSLTFDQLPWFTVADRLEVEKGAMMDERDKVRAKMSEQEGLIAIIEAQLAKYKEAMDACQSELAELQGQVTTLKRSEDAALSDAKAGRDELKRVRKENMKLKDKLESERKEHAQIRDRYEAMIRSLREDVSFAEARVRRAQAETEEASAEMERRLPPEIIERLRGQVDSFQSRLSEREKTIIEMREELEKLRDEKGGSTRRPSWSGWKEQNLKIADTTRETVSAAAVVLSGYVEQVQRLQRTAELAQALLPPDPLPGPLKLSITVDTASYFITEGEGTTEVSTSQKPPIAAPLGLAPHVPRCFRWDKPVDLVEFSIEDTEAIVAHVWKEKRTFETDHPSSTLLSFLHEYLSRRCIPTTAAFKAQSSAPSAHHLQSSPSSRFTLASPARSMTPDIPSTLTANAQITATTSTGPVASARPAERMDVPTAAYSLLHALDTHSAASPPCRLFLSVLTGVLPEGVYADQQMMLAGVVAAVSALPLSLAEGGERISTDSGVVLGDPKEQCISHRHVASLLARFIKDAPAFTESRLAAALAAEFPSGSAPFVDLLGAVNAFTEPFATEPYILQPPAISNLRQQSSAVSVLSQSLERISISGMRASISKELEAQMSTMSVAQAPVSARSDPALRSWLPFVITLMDLHLEGIKSAYTDLGLKVLRSLQGHQALSAPADNEIKLSLFLTALEGAIGREPAETTAVRVLGLADREHLRGLLASGAKVAPQIFLRRLSTSCWLKLDGAGWDVTRAIAWAKSLTEFTM